MDTKQLLIFGALALAGGLAQAQAVWQALPDKAPAPADNPTTAARVDLGKMLYFDPRFSSTGSVSCFSCHNVMEGGDDHMATSIGVHGQKGGRNAPTVWNAAFNSAQFWDGRAATLEDQAKGPPVNPIEMGMDLHSPRSSTGSSTFPATVRTSRRRSARATSRRWTTPPGRSPPTSARS